MRDDDYLYFYHTSGFEDNTVRILKRVKLDSPRNKNFLRRSEDEFQQAYERVVSNNSGKGRGEGRRNNNSISGAKGEPTEGTASMGDATSRSNREKHQGNGDTSDGLTQQGTPSTKTPAQVKADEADVKTKEGQGKPKTEEKPKDTDFAKKTKAEKIKSVDSAVDEALGTQKRTGSEDFVQRVKASKKFVKKTADDPLLSETYKKLGKELLEMSSDTERVFDVLGNMKANGEAGKKVYDRMSRAVDRARTAVKDDFDEVYNRVMNAKVDDDGISLVGVDPYARIRGRKQGDI